MRDYKLLAEGLRYCSKHICNKECGYYEICHRDRGKEYPSVTSVGFDAADAIEELIATARSVVHCKDCEWWTKQDASIQGRCARFGFYPTGKFYCASGSMAEPPKGVE